MKKTVLLVLIMIGIVPCYGGRIFRNIIERLVHILLENDEGRMKNYGA